MASRAMVFASQLPCAFAVLATLVLSPPARAAWIETQTLVPTEHVLSSPPARAAWIETRTRASPEPQSLVAARAGGVD